MILFSYPRPGQAATWLASLVVAVSCPSARPAVFHDVPASCASELAAYPSSWVAPVVDWRPWLRFLRELGYEDVRVREIWNEQYWRLGELARLDNVTAWPSLVHVDGPELLEDALARHLERSSDFGPRLLRFLLQRAPFWLPARDPRGVAPRVLAMVEDRELARAYLAMELALAPEARPALREALFRRIETAVKVRRYRLDQTLLHLASLVPWAEIPPDLRRHFDEWVDLAADPPLRTERIETSGFGLVDANNCRHMAGGHLAALGLALHPAYRGRPRLVRVGGEIVGALKRGAFGEPSMIALRNAIDRRGRLVLVLGAVYKLPFAIWNDCETADVAVNRLRVGPVDFLLNHAAWDAKNVPDLFALGTDRETAERRAAEFAAEKIEHFDFMPWSDARREWHARTRASLARRLTQIRRAHEGAP